MNKPIPKYAYGIEECIYCGNKEGKDLEYSDESRYQNMVTRCIDAKACEVREFAREDDEDNE